MKQLITLLLLLSALSASAEDSIRIQFITPTIVRVTTSVQKDFPSNSTGICVYPQPNVEVRKTVSKDDVRYESSELTVRVSRPAMTVTFEDKKGNPVLSQQPTLFMPSYQERIIYDENSAHVEETANGKVTVKDVLRRDTIGKSTSYVTSFFSKDEKALYGLGCQMEDYMNLKGKTLWLTQHNLKVHVPMLLSTNGYGLLFDAGCAMSFQNRKDTTTIQLEAAKSLDYYFIYGKISSKETAESLCSNESSLPSGRLGGGFSLPLEEGWGEVLISAYRYLTGSVSMMPRYVFGYTQSKERYCSSDEIVSTLKEYRRRHVPIDMIVQDWNYWPQGWGYMKMDPKYYPSPRALADSVHALNAKLMVSIWPNPQWCPEADDFKSRGMMLEHDIYDAFNPDARKHYWKYANDEFFSNGFDAWWCDSSEPLDGDWNRPPTKVPSDKCQVTSEDTSAEEVVPYTWDSHKYRWELNKDILSESLGQERSSLFSLYHSMGIYENQRRQNSLSSGDGRGEVRVVNLTRSSYAGQQRYGTIVWNGDTHASWESFRQQIPAGLNYMATGNPYWTVDVGSFFTKDDGRRWFYKGEFPDGVKSDAYKEYYVRMFQWATFLPMLRSHGSDTPREIWQFGEPGTPYYDAILKMINLRYQHVPYIYSMAAYQSGIISSPCGRSGGFSMARPLAFDFVNDTTVLDMKDEYMFGDYLVCPVTHPISETATRKVYLPKGAKGQGGSSVQWGSMGSKGSRVQRSSKGSRVQRSSKGSRVQRSSKVHGTLWFDYWNNQTYEGGQWIECMSAIDNLPLFVRGGSIIPTTEVAEYTDAQVGKPVTINVYPGKDAEFTLYEDEGNNYNYEKGAYSLIPMKWDEAKHILTIGKRAGSYLNMIDKRSFIVKTPTTTKEVTYKGKEIRIKL